MHILTTENIVYVSEQDIDPVEPILMTATVPVKSVPTHLKLVLANALVVTDPPDEVQVPLAMFVFPVTVGAVPIP